VAGTYTTIAEQRSLDWLFTTGAPTRPTTWYVSLHTGANGGAGAANELSGNGYARQAVTFTRSGQTVSNNALITFGPNTTTNWGTVTDACVWDSLTTGTCLAQGTLTSSVAYAVGDSATIAAGALTISLT
jgi:hypothetical protein